MSVMRITRIDDIESRQIADAYARKNGIVSWLDLPELENKR